MEDELFALVYALLQDEGNKRPRRGRKQYSDVLILAVYFWAVVHDRPTCWACQRCHWPAVWHWLSLPSQPTLSRRLRSFAVVQLLMMLMDRLRQVRAPGMRADPLVHVIDSRPLVVGGFSKDRECRWGYATGGKARGYKCCALLGTAVVPEQLLLGALNLADAVGAAELLQRSVCQGYVLADATHDTNALHQLARAQGVQLLSPRKAPGSGLGHCHHDPGRLRSIALLEAPSSFGRRLYRLREPIERHFGNCSSFGGGLAPLPSWVRTPQRVVRWLWAKEILNGLRICINKGLAA
jgi:hypothetical protein